MAIGISFFPMRYSINNIWGIETNKLNTLQLSNAFINIIIENVNNLIYNCLSSKFI